MRTSFGLFGIVGLVALSACSVSTTDNSITFKTKPEFVDVSQPAQTAMTDWNGEDISIKNDGVNPLVGAGGIVVNFDSSATKISVKADFAARADVEADARESIKDAIGTLKITESNGFTINCGHGGKHGSSDVANSGCKRMVVTLPTGSAAKPVRLTIGNGMGDVKFQGTAPTVSYLKVDNNGLGDVDVSVVPVKDAELVVIGEDKVSVGLPPDFTAASVVLDAGSGSDAATRIITTDFPEMKSGQAFGTAGANTVKVLNVLNKGLLSDDTITIKKF